MSATIPDIGVTLTAEPQPSSRRRRAVIGQGIRLRATFYDRATGLSVAVDDPVITVQPPATSSGALPAPLAFSAAGLTAGGTGTWYVDVLADKAGAWQARAECTSPRAAAGELGFDVTATGVVPPPAASPMLVTDDLGPIVTQSGGVLTAKRVTELPEATDPAGLVLAGAQRGEARHVTWESLKADVDAEARAAAQAYTDSKANATAISWASTRFPGAAARPLAEYVEAEVGLHQFLQAGEDAASLYAGSSAVDGAAVIRRYLAAVKQLNAQATPRGLHCKLAPGVINLDSYDPSGSTLSNASLDLAAGVPASIDGGNPGNAGGYALRIDGLNGWALVGAGKGVTILKSRLLQQGNKYYNFGVFSIQRAQNVRIANLTVDHQTGGWANGTHLIGCNGLLNVTIEDCELFGKLGGGYVIEAGGDYGKAYDGSKKVLVVRNCEMWGGENDVFDLKNRQPLDSDYWPGNYAVVVENNRIHIRGTNNKTGCDFRGVGLYMGGNTVLIHPGAYQAIGARIRADGTDGSPDHIQWGGKHSHIQALTVINLGGTFATGLSLQGKGVNVHGLTCYGLDRYGLVAVAGQSGGVKASGIRIIADRVTPLTAAQNGSYGISLTDDCWLDGFEVRGAYTAGVYMRGQNGHIANGIIDGCYVNYQTDSGTVSRVDHVTSLNPITAHKSDLGHTTWIGNSPGLADRNTLIGWQARRQGRVGLEAMAVAGPQGAGSEQSIAWRLGCATDDAATRRLLTADRTGSAVVTADYKNVLYVPLNGMIDVQITVDAMQQKGGTVGTASDCANWSFQLIARKGSSEASLNICQVGTTIIPSANQGASFPPGTGMQLAPNTVPQDTFSSGNTAWLGNCRLVIERNTATGAIEFYALGRDNRPLNWGMRIAGQELVRADVRLLDWKQQPSTSKPAGYQTTVRAYSLIDGAPVTFAVKDSGGNTVQTSAPVAPVDGIATWVFTRPATGTSYTVQATAAGTSLGTITSTPFDSVDAVLSITGLTLSGAPGSKQTIAVRTTGTFLGDVTLTWSYADGSPYAGDPDFNPIIVPEPDDPAATAVSVDIYLPPDGLYRLTASSPYSVDAVSGVVNTLPTLQFNTAPTGGAPGSAQTIAVKSNRTWFGTVTVQYVDATTLAPVGPAYTGNKTGGQVNIPTTRPNVPGSYKVLISGDQGVNSATSGTITVA